MKKIRFNISNDCLSISYKQENNTIKNINNTNIISDENFIFDPKYLKNNFELVANFLRVIIENEGTKRAVVDEEELIIPALNLLNYIPSIKYLIIKPDIDIDYDTHMAILKNDTLRRIECYAIPAYLLERIDTTKSVKIDTRNEVFFKSNFILENNLSNYSDIFYKRKIVISYIFNDSDYKDLETFLSLNNHLKYVYFDIVNIDFLKKIVSILKKYHKKNMGLSIKGIDNNLKYFEEIEAFIKKDKFIKEANFKFKIDYTKEYRSENFIRLLNFTSARYILVAVMISALLGYGINTYNLYLSSKQVTDISDDLSEILDEYSEYDEPEESGEIGGDDDIYTEPEVNKKYVSPYYTNYSKVISVLKNTNPDTVGWLTVNNTTVNYPVVQSTNNSYYLTHDFNKKSNSLGWVFMDYRNDAINLQRNTIIFGHNISKAKLMFGNLSATLNPSWYQKAENQYITFNTETSDMRWKIFAIYNIPATNDYLYNSFDSDETFLAFVDKMKSRSVYNFNTTVTANDKILTLSTCQNNAKNRLVVHAVLEK